MVGQRERVHFLTAQLYRNVVGDEQVPTVVNRLISAIGATAPVPSRQAPAEDLWSQRDVALITYGDSIIGDGLKPLRVLREFCEMWLALDDWAREILAQPGQRCE